MGAWSALSATCHCDLSRDADYRTLTSHLVKCKSLVPRPDKSMAGSE